MIYSKQILALSLTLVLSACGGGGSGCNALVPLATCVDSTPVNVAPVAIPGTYKSVVTLSDVLLDGSASTDANNDKLTYLWALESKPAGSTLVWTAEMAVLPAPTFKTDKAGNYVLSLVVYDGKAYSQKVEVTVAATDANLPPVANAGNPHSVTLLAPMAPVILDGSGSSDPNMDKLTYAWSVEDPDGVAVALDSSSSPKPRFTPSKVGTYIADLLVSDPRGGSSTARVRVVVSKNNSAPVANAGADQSVVTGNTVKLTGLASTDADGNALSYKWVLSKPSGSVATLNVTAPAEPTFTADLDGTYTASLVVNDGKVDSAVVSTVRVTAGPLNVPPVALATATPTSVSLAALAAAKLVTLDGSGSSDSNNDVLTYTWILTSFPDATAPTLTVDPTNAAKATFTPTAQGTYVATLVVSDGKLSSQVGVGSTVVVTALP